MIDLSRWPDADELLDAALALPSEEREAFLERTVKDAELRTALAAVLAEDQEAFLTPGGALESSVYSDLEHGGLDALPRRVGPFRLIREVGRGGMARVFEGERIDGGFQQSVAIKLMRAAGRSPDLLQRFEQERQILAGLHHRSIARLYEGGNLDDGEPYFVMELVDGEPIESYCRSTRAGLRTRLGLFIAVAEAVSYAHRNLIVHRDIKSSNVMIDREGEVKLLDFGIAKIVGPLEHRSTATLDRVLTPEYASPEQLQGEPITTASDIYQLGHLLYRLLCDRSPYEGRTTTPADLHSAILTDTPVLPSAAAARPTEGSSPAWAKTLRGDLDAVVMKALRKEPERRYQTAQELIEDLRAYLDGEPVRARPDSFLYRTRKLVLRNRAASAVVLLAALLVAALVTTFTLRLSGERDRALASARRAEAMTGFLEQLFLDANPNVSGRSDLSARELIERAPERIESELTGQPLVQSMLFGLTGRLMSALGEEELSDAWLTRALDLANAQGDEGSRSKVEAMRSLAALRIEQHREEEALGLLDQATQATAGMPIADRLEEARLLETRAQALVSLGRYEEALDQYELTTAALNALDPATDVRFALHVQEGHGRALRLSKRDPDGAIALLEQNLAARRSFYGEGHPQLLSGLQDLAAAYGSRGFDARAKDAEAGSDDLGQVEELLEEAFTISTQHFGENHPNGARICLLQGALAYANGDWDGVRGRYGKAVEIFDSLAGYEDDAALASMYLGVADLKSGHLERSIPIFNRALEAFADSASAQHWRVAGIYYYLGEAQFGLERWLLARTSFSEAHARYLGSNGPDNARTRVAKLGVADCELNLADLQSKNGRRAEATASLERARALYQTIPELLDGAREARLANISRSAAAAER